MGLVRMCRRCGSNSLALLLNRSKFGIPRLHVTDRVKSALVYRNDYQIERSMKKEALEHAKNLFFIALGIDIAVTLLVMGTDFWSISIITNIKEGIAPADQSALSRVDFWASFSSIMILTWIGVGFALLNWLSACYEYGRDTLKATGFAHEGWKTWGWIVPFLNLYKPYQVISEIYKIGAKDEPHGGAWNKSAGSGWLIVWWFFWVFAHLVVSILAKTARDVLTFDQIIGHYYVHVAICVISAIVASLWFIVADKLTLRLQDRSANVSAPTRPAYSEFVTQPKPTEPPSLPRVVQRDQSGNIPMQQVLPVTVFSATENDEEFWALALVEVDGDTRRPGLWAKVFSMAQGNENVAKAQYLQERVQQMIEELQRQQAAHLELESRSVAQRDAALAHLARERRAYADQPKGSCPNCRSVILLNATECQKCRAIFGLNSVWKVNPIHEKAQLELLREAFLTGQKLTVDEVIFLAHASTADKVIATLVDRVQGESLLHWAARFGLLQEASLLLINGADAEQINGKDQKPFDLTEHYKMQELLSNHQTIRHASIT
jgi:Domain of unknown function (DUF4328)